MIANLLTNTKHITAPVPNKRLCIDMFFAIAGYLISGIISYQNEYNGNAKSSKDRL